VCSEVVKSRTESSGRRGEMFGARYSAVCFARVGDEGVLCPAVGSSNTGVIATIQRPQSTILCRKLTEKNLISVTRVWFGKKPYISLVFGKKKTPALYHLRCFFASFGTEVWKSWPAEKLG
jgi:hypothetical protein